MDYDKYDEGRKICEKLFWKTGDIRYYNMMKGFENLKEINKSQSTKEEPFTMC